MQGGEYSTEFKIFDLTNLLRPFVILKYRNVLKIMQLYYKDLKVLSMQDGESSYGMKQKVNFNCDLQVVLDIYHSRFAYSSTCANFICVPNSKICF